MSDDMEVRCAALRMEYQKRMVRSNFIGIVLIFCFFCIKTKDEHQLLMLLYKLKWFLVHRPSFFEQRITDNELDSCRFIEIEFLLKIK
jgi:hypothetical protein